MQKNFQGHVWNVPPGYMHAKYEAHSFNHFAAISIYVKIFFMPKNISIIIVIIIIGTAINIVL